MNKKALSMGILILLVLPQPPIYAAPDMSPEAIFKRIKPVGEVALESNSGATHEKPNDKTVNENTAAPMDPEKIYQTTCAACHTTGAAGAPKLGDQDEWKIRLAKGKKILVDNAIKGYKLMPPKGTCVQCSDEEIKAVVLYIINQSRARQ